MTCVHFELKIKILGLNELAHRTLKTFAPSLLTRTEFTAEMILNITECETAWTSRKPMVCGAIACSLHFLPHFTQDGIQQCSQCYSMRVLLCVFLEHLMSMNVLCPNWTCLKHFWCVHTAADAVFNQLLVLVRNNLFLFFFSDHHGQTCRWTQTSTGQQEHGWRRLNLLMLL